MPVYKYKCKKCNYIFEMQLGMNDSLPNCPKCNENVKKLLSLTTVGSVQMTSREFYNNKIQPEAKEIVKQIKEGNEEVAADIFGEDKLYES